MRASRPVATTEYVRQQVDEQHQPLALVCLDLDISTWLGSRLLEAGRASHKAQKALKKGASNNG